MEVSPVSFHYGFGVEATRNSVWVMRMAARTGPLSEPATLLSPPARFRSPPGNFADAQTALRCPHLHFQIPAVGFFAHVQAFQGLARDGAERAHVCVFDTVEGAEKDSRHPSGEDLRDLQAAWLARAAHARADHEITFAG